MKVVDANVLLYAVNEDIPHHAVARGWMEQALAGSEPVGFPWVSLLAFVRISTNRRIFENALTPTMAFDLVEAWLASPASVVLEPTRRHPSVLRGLLEQAGTAGNLTTDAHLAALAMEHGATVVTFDRDFGRFDVRFELPG